MSAFAVLLSCGTGSIDLFPGARPDAGTVEPPSGDTAEMPPQTDSETGCASDTVCMMVAGLHRCDLALGQCVECLGDTDCANRNDSKCNVMTHGCERPCAASSDCLGTDVCDTTQMVCASCLVDSTCPQSAPHCVSERCTCLSDAECGANEHCAAGACVDCVTSADCPAGMECAANHECQ
jgi:hypothetical protein